MSAEFGVIPKSRAELALPFAEGLVIGGHLDRVDPSQYEHHQVA